MDAAERVGESLPNLEVVLMANGAEVARSKSPEVWLSTMAQITGRAAPAPLTSGTPVAPSAAFAARSGGTAAAAQDPLPRFAEELGVRLEELEFAAAPSSDAPFIHLDHKYWQALKANTPSRGRGSIAPAALAATLLLLWNRHAKFGEVTTRLCSQVLATIDLRDKNPGRAIKGCEWLQLRGSAIKINATLINEAEAAARAYCTRSKPPSEV